MVLQAAGVSRFPLRKPRLVYLFVKVGLSGRDISYRVSCKIRDNKSASNKQQTDWYSGRVYHKEFLLRLYLIVVYDHDKNDSKTGVISP